MCPWVVNEQQLGGVARESVCVQYGERATRRFGNVGRQDLVELALDGFPEKTPVEIGRIRENREFKNGIMQLPGDGANAGRNFTANGTVNSKLDRIESGQRRWPPNGPAFSSERQESVDWMVPSNRRAGARDGRRQ